jgi:pyruvate dehydrogenase E2 component (dihydrolipoamide acetyltransferase)
MALRDVPRLTIRMDKGVYRQSPTSAILMVVARESGLALVEAPDALADGWETFLRGMKAAVHKDQPSVAGATGLPSRPLLALSNLGMFGLKEFAAIIPPGCNAVLAIGAVRDAPIVRNGRLEVGRICTVTLSADHRVVDGIAAARFLQKLQHHLNSL